nr:MAG TPA: hypothetical protein [Caudoviricetes sp.]
MRPFYQCSKFNRFVLCPLPAKRKGQGMNI